MAEPVKLAVARPAEVHKPPPPHDLDAERSVLGGALIDARAIDVVDAILRDAGDFYDPAHAEIWTSVRAMASEGHPVDVVTLAAHLRARERLNTVGGALYLGELLDATASTAHIEAHASIVADLAQLRRAMTEAEAFLARGHGNTGDVATFLTNANEKFARITERRAKSDPSSMANVVHDTLKELEDRANAVLSVDGITTGFEQLDALLCGFRPGQLIVVAARPGVGKSIFATNIARHAAGRGSRVLFVSLEMSKIEIGERMLCCEARIDQNRYNGNTLSPEETARLVAAAGVSYTLPMFVDTPADATLAAIRAPAARLKKTESGKGLHLIVVDYLQLMSAPGIEKREQQVASISRGLKRLAVQLGVPIVALSQLNRSVDQRGRDARPKLSDLRESGAIENDADKVLFIWREEMVSRKPKERGVAEIIVAKQRKGFSTGTVRLRFIGEQARFESMPPEEAQPYAEDVPDPPEPPRRGRRRNQRDFYGRQETFEGGDT